MGTSTKTRREFLGATLAGSFGLAGCTSVLDADAEVNIRAIRVINSDSAEHEVRVVVLRQGSVVFSDQRTADAKDGDVTGGYVLSSGWEEADGEYAVAAQIDRNPWQQRTLDTDDESDCVGVIVRIEEDGTGVILTASRRTCRTR